MPGAGRTAPRWLEAEEKRLKPKEGEESQGF